MMEEKQNPGYEALKTMITQKRIPDDIAQIIVSELIRHNKEWNAFRHNPKLVPRIKQYVLGPEYLDHFVELKAQANQS